MNRTKFIQEYLDRGFSLIPLKNNSKVPAIRWKKYQYRRAGLEEILSWYIKFPGANLGIITGKISKFVVIDTDDPSILPELFKRLPEAEKTTRVKTRRCYHFCFSHNGKEIKSTNNFLNLGCELKAEGRLVVACPSIIDNFTYHFIIPLSEIKPLPEYIIERLEGTLPGIGIKEGGQAPDIEYKRRKALPLPRYNGLNRYCMKQILDRELKAGVKGKAGERDINLFILYNLLLQNKNNSDHAKKITILKNNSLMEPLTDQELKKVFRKRYSFKCSTIRETLPYIECDKCKFKFKGGKLEVVNVLVKNIRKLPELSNTESRVVLLLGTYYEGENPTNYEIAKKTGMNKGTVKEAIESLKKKGIIE